MSSSQHHTTDPTHAPGAGNQFTPTGADAQPISNSETSAQSSAIQRTALTIADLAALAASNNSSSVFLQNAVRTLRIELEADAVLILDYTDAFGGKAVRAAAGLDSVVIGTDLWLPDHLSPVDVNTPVKLVDVESSQFNAISAMAGMVEYRSALAIAIPAVTGAAGMVIALASDAVDFDESQIEQAKTVVSLLSLTASRSNALNIAERGESQLATSRLITRSITPEPTQEAGDSGHTSLLEKVSGLLAPYFEFDVVAVRTELDGEFVTQEVQYTNTGGGHTPSVVPAVSESTIGTRPIEFRATDYGVALTNAAKSTGNYEPELAWKSAGIESVLAIPVPGGSRMAIVLGSSRFNAYSPESVATASRFIPALTSVFATDLPPTTAPQPAPQISNTPEYVAAIASATELVSACGVIATQITKRTDATRVQVGFFNDESGRAEIGFDTESSDHFLDHTWIAPEDIEQVIEAAPSDTTEDQTVSKTGFTTVRTGIRVTDRVIGFVEATRSHSGFSDQDTNQIKEITRACSQVIATLRQLEQSESTLKKFEMLRRVTDQIRADRSENPINSPRIASLIRNLFDADWVYFGAVDHENDHSTTEITDGLSVPELAPGVRVSRRSLLMPSTLSASSPVTVDLESAAPGQRAAGRWMYRAGLRSALCAPLRIDGVVTTMFMCASRKPTGFGSLEKKMLSSIIAELEVALERASRDSASPQSRKGSAQIVLEQLGSNFEAILNNASALVLNIDHAGVVTSATGRGIEGLKLTSDRLIGRDFISYSRKIDGLEHALENAIDGHASRIELEVFGTILDAWVEPNADSDDATSAATVVVSDITDRVTASRAETALSVLREEQERTNKFIVSLSHEMKSPLTTVVALTDLLCMNERGNLHPDQLERLSVVQQNADRLTLLVNDFLNVSKMEAGTFESKPTKFQISELAHDLQTSFEPIAKAQDHNLVVTAPDDNQFATADRELLRQAIMNLLTNATKYSPTNTNVSLDIWVDDNDLRVTVTDEGAGIPHSERDRVFEAYNQLDNPDVPGNGMGLAIVRQIIELHHGKVWVEDGVGGGTSLAFWLPESVTSS